MLLKRHYGAMTLAFSLYHGVYKTVTCCCHVARTIEQSYGILNQARPTVTTRLSPIGHFRRDGIRTTPTCSLPHPLMASSRFKRCRIPTLQAVKHWIRPKLQMEKTSFRKHRLSRNLRHSL